MNPSTRNHTRAAAVVLLAALVCLVAAGALTSRLGFVASARSAATPAPTGGSRIAFMTPRDGNNEIYLIDPATGAEQRLTNDPANDLEPALSADGTRVAFTSTRGNGFPDIWVMNADGTNQHNVTNTANSAVINGRASWSPDGASIVFQRNSDIWVMNADGTNQTMIVAQGEDPAWSPDGQWIAFASNRAGSTAGSSLIWIVHPDGSALRQVTFAPIGFDVEPSWSPDSRKIAFTTTRTSGGEVWSVEVGSGAEKRLVTIADGNGSQPAWSPDGTEIAFVAARLAALGIYTSDIYVMDADGTGQTRLTSNPANDSQPSWQALAPAPPPAPTPNTPAGQNVSVPLGGVNVSFDGVTAPGDTTVAPIDPATVAGLLPGQYKLDDGAGGALPAYEIASTAAHAGNITVCINLVPPVTDANIFANLRILHGEGGALVDRTILAPDRPEPFFGTPPSLSDQTICARTTSLSPFVVARLANRAPVAAAHNVTVEADGSCSAAVTAADVDGGSSDPDGDAFTLSLSPAAPFGLGAHAVTLTATDSHGATSTAAATVTVVDTTPPQISAPPDVTAYTGAGAFSCGAFVSDADLGAANASDNCALNVTRAGVPAGNVFPVGTTVVTYTATDAAGNKATATQSVTVIDDTPPAITSAAVDKPVLSPPNHRMVDVTLSYSALDNCGTVSTSLAVASNEPVNGPGEGGTAPDWEIVDAHHVRLRAERSGGGAGRLYTITITASDARGNAASRQVTVSVPHN